MMIITQDLLVASNTLVVISACSMNGALIHDAAALMRLSFLALQVCLKADLYFCIKVVSQLRLCCRPRRALRSMRTARNVTGPLGRFVLLHTSRRYSFFAVVFKLGRTIVCSNVCKNNSCSTFINASS